MNDCRFYFRYILREVSRSCNICGSERVFLIAGLKTTLWIIKIIIKAADFKGMTIYRFTVITDCPLFKQWIKQLFWGMVTRSGNWHWKLVLQSIFFFYLCSTLCLSVTVNPNKIHLSLVVTWQNRTIKKIRKNTFALENTDNWDAALKDGIDKICVSHLKPCISAQPAAGRSFKLANMNPSKK